MKPGMVSSGLPAEAAGIKSREFGAPSANPKSAAPLAICFADCAARLFYVGANNG